MNDEFKTLQSRVNARVGREFKPTEEPTNGYEHALFMREVLEWSKDVEKRLQSGSTEPDA